MDGITPGVVVMFYGRTSEKRCDRAFTREKSMAQGGTHFAGTLCRVFDRG